MDSSVIFWHNIKQSMFAFFKKLIKHAWVTEQMLCWDDMPSTWD